MKKLIFILALMLSPLILISQHKYFKDVTIKSMATPNTTVATFTSTGKIDSLETADITEVTHDTLSADFVDITNDLDVGDTLEFDNGAQIHNEETDTLFLTETVIKLTGDVKVTGNITNTPARGGSYISTAGTQTIGTGGTFEKLYEGTMAYTACCLHDFTESNGRLTYTGTLTINMAINCNLSGESGEAAQIVQFRLAKNGTTIAGTNMTREFTTQNKDGCVGLNWLLEMSTNDYIEVFGTSDTNGDTFDINNLTLSIVKN